MGSYIQAKNSAPYPTRIAYFQSNFWKCLCVN